MKTKAKTKQKRAVCMVPGCTAYARSCGVCHNHDNQQKASPKHDLRWYIDNDLRREDKKPSLLREVERAIEERESLQSEAKKRRIDRSH